MAEERGRKLKFVPAEKVTTVARDGSPPAWAIGVVVATIAAVILLYEVPGIAYAIFPFAHSDYFWVGLIFLPMVVMIAAMVISKGVDLRRAKSWTATTGTIVRSELEAKHHRFQGEAETVTNAPAVEYEFSIGARKYRGSRIGIGDDSGGANTEATLQRYPKGATVTVYYDPAEPKNCVLERGGPFAHDDAPAPVAQADAAPAAAKTQVTARGCLFESVILIAIGYGIYWLLTQGPKAIAARFPKSEPEVTIFAACFGLAALLFFLAYRRYLKQAQAWPTVKGRIVKSAVTSFRETTDGHTRTMYRPEIEYVYPVRGQNYSSTQIKLGMAVSGSQAYAEKVAGKYRTGDTVEVHYDPQNPGTAALENPTGMTWLIAAVALACFGIAAYTLGITK